MLRLSIAIILLGYSLLYCSSAQDKTNYSLTLIKKIADIPLPKGYKRLLLSNRSFGYWLRQLPVRNDNRLYLFNGQLKNNQNNHYAIIDKPIGKKDLQQCADVVMRLRTEYLLSIENVTAIKFVSNNKTYQLQQYGNTISGKFYISPEKLNTFLENVFINCGTASLSKQLRQVNLTDGIKPGNVFIKGGYPGHAALVVDVAVHEQSGKLIFLLLQGYMPAQDIHIVKNLKQKSISPWFTYEAGEDVVTPDWIFKPSQLSEW